MVPASAGSAGIALAGKQHSSPIRRGAIARGERGKHRPVSSKPALGTARYRGVADSRPGHETDSIVSSMPVEADVYQQRYLLDPGMFAEAIWPLQSAGPLLFVPRAAIMDKPRPSVERASNGEIQTVDVTPGRTMGGLVQVVGDLRAGDLGGTGFAGIGRRDAHPASPQGARRRRIGPPLRILVVSTSAGRRGIAAASTPIAANGATA